MGRLFALLCGLLLAGCGTPSFLVTPVSSSSSLREVEVQPGEGWASGKIAIIEVDGLIANAKAGGFLMPTENPISLFSQQLDVAAGDKRVRAIVLRINSPGGTVTGSETLYNLVIRFKNRTGKPVVAAAQEVAASGGYMVALPADHIMAMPTSIVGSIGVLMQLFTIDGTLGMIGVKSETIKAGEFKDTGSPFRPMRAEDRVYLQQMVDDYFVRFRAHVEKHRALTGDAAARATVFDGRVFTGDQALAAGLIDSVGTLEDAIDKARELGGDSRAKAVMYIRPYGYTGSIYAHQPLPPAQMQSPAMRFELPEAIAPLAPGFYYLWRP